MAQYTSTDLRNIALVGHAGSGKTTLAEALLHAAGAIKTPGTTQRGTTVCDFDPREKELQHSLETALCRMDTDSAHINLIDTPGYPDFIGRSLSILPAVETVAVVVNAATGIELVTERMLEAAAERGLCRMIIINKMDDPKADLAGLLGEVQETFGRECLPINLPTADRNAVADCFFSPEGAATAVSSVSQAHTEIIDQVVDVDEALMEIYLEQGQELDPEQLHDPFEKALREGHLVPVCFVSAQSGAGVPELLNILQRLMPNPLEGNPPPFLKGEGPEASPVDVLPDPEHHVIAHVFKVSIDPFVGRLGVFRVHQGTIRPNAQLYVGDGRKPFKVAHLYGMQGKELWEMPCAIPGDICALAKLDDLHFDAVLHDSHEEDHFHLKTMECPPPMYGLAVEPERHGDEQKLSDTLQKLEAEDPCLQVEHRATLNETVIHGTGELHLRVVLDKMSDQYNVAVKTHAPSIAYRETIGGTAEGHHRHKKQTGGAGQFGEVYLRVHPLERGEGFRFHNEVVGGAIPSQFIPAVEKGVRQMVESGTVAGFPMQDLAVTVHDGKHHSVDSKEVAFVMAGRKAFVEAVQKASPMILEPVATIRIIAPSDHMGDLTGGLAGIRGIISSTRTLSGNRVEIAGQVPLGELTEYQSTLKSVTGGEGSYTIEFSHYAPAPTKIQRELMNAYRSRNHTE